MQIVESVDETKFFADYLTLFCSSVIEQCEDNLRAMGIYDEIIINNHIAKLTTNSHEFKMLILQRTTDYLFALNFINCNKKTFYINNNLMEYLAQTKLDADSKILQLPFECCVFVLTSIGLTQISMKENVTAHINIHQVTLV